MKAIFASALLLMVIFSCSKPENALQEALDLEHRTDSLFLEFVGQHVHTLIYENCEYLILKHHEGTHGYGFMSHKGNCSNPIHCRTDDITTE